MDTQKQHGNKLKALRDRNDLLLFFTAVIIRIFRLAPNPERCADHKSKPEADGCLLIGGSRKLKSKRNSQKMSTLPEYFLCEIDNIKSTCATLLTILNAQGLKHGEIRQFISDVIHIVEYGGIFTVASVNHALESLGWPQQLINEISFELIIEVLESIFEYQVEVHTVH